MKRTLISITVGILIGLAVAVIVSPFATDHPDNKYITVFSRYGGTYLTPVGTLPPMIMFPALGAAAGFLFGYIRNHWKW